MSPTTCHLSNTYCSVSERDKDRDTITIVLGWKAKTCKMWLNAVVA